MGVVPIELTTVPDGVLLPLRVSAGSARQQLVGPHGDRLKLAVRAPPERGKANRAILRLLSAELGIPVGDMEIRTGASSPSKIVLVRGIAADRLMARIEAALEK